MKIQNGDMASILSSLVAIRSMSDMMLSHASAIHVFADKGIKDADLRRAVNMLQDGVPLDDMPTAKDEEDHHARYLATLATSLRVHTAIVMEVVARSLEADNV